MSWNDCQIFNLDEDLGSPMNPSLETERSQLLLEWIVENPFFESEVFESEIEISGQNFYRFSINATDPEGHAYYGIGRSKTRLQAASIAAGEVIERFAATKVLKSNTPFFARHLVNVKDSEISLCALPEMAPLPSNGFHSSNGWAVHFSLKSAIEKSVIEALERHTLLYSYLHSGWDGFYADNQVPFKGQQLTPYISRFSFGGFSAGIVATEGNEFQGRTFGYLCDDAEAIYKSSKWLSAFFESFGQWESLVANWQPAENANALIQYQRHFLTTPPTQKTSNTFIEKLDDVSDIRANILLLDLNKALKLPVPMFAAYSFGGNLIPLFFKQNLSSDEAKILLDILQNWKLPTSLPEVHPIL